MESLFFKLKDILIKQQETVLELVSLAQEHTLAMKENNANQILAVVKQLENQSNILQAQDEARKEIQTELALSLGLPAESTLSHILQHTAQQKVVQEINDLSLTINNNLAQLKDILKLNDIMAKRGLMFTQQLKNIMQPKDNSTYQRSGEVVKQSGNRSLFDKSI